MVKGGALGGALGAAPLFSAPLGLRPTLVHPVEAGTLFDGSRALSGGGMLLGGFGESYLAGEDRKERNVHSGGTGFLQGTVEKRVACDHCGLLFGDVNSLKRHAARAHRASTGKGPVYCSQCNAGLKNEQNLRRHIAVCHSGDQAHKCDMCTASFSSRGSLRIHQQSVHAMAVGKRSGRGGKRGRGRGVGAAANGRSYVCDMCTDTFKWKGNLKRHRELRHLQLRPFVCKVCNASFGTKSNMRVHLITHNNATTATK